MKARADDGILRKSPSRNRPTRPWSASVPLPLRLPLRLRRGGAHDPPTRYRDAVAAHLGYYWADASWPAPSNLAALTAIAWNEGWNQAPV
ncbi:hypothetical protein [Salinispora arenicola]|uniref:hypothetical protein n=1 Tax=Salinispora arenicola TaxID=168697 RepID=UPI0016B0E153|nr:hypothetical protein [Salinispora arenicola]NIL64880.1 hypothetical protein [Salinispora arenicola]